MVFTVSYIAQKYSNIFLPQVEKTFMDVTGDVHPVVVLGYKENDTVAEVCTV